MATTKKKKSAAKKPAAKKSAVKKPARKAGKKKPTFDPSPFESFEGERLVTLLGASPTDMRVVSILRELGYHKPVGEHGVELKKLGLSLTFDNDKGLKQIQFEIRRAWTGHSRYPGKLPYGISSDHKTKESDATMGGTPPARTNSSGGGWAHWDMPGHEIAIGFGKTFIETVFVMARP